MKSLRKNSSRLNFFSNLQKPEIEQCWAKTTRTTGDHYWDLTETDEETEDEEDENEIGSYFDNFR